MNGIRMNECSSFSRFQERKVLRGHKILERHECHPSNTFPLDYFSLRKLRFGLRERKVCNSIFNIKPLRAHN